MDETLKHKKVQEAIIMRKGRRHSGKKLQPPLPEAKDELHLPKYFGIIRGSGYNKAEEERRETIPGPMPRADESPRAISGRQPLLQPSPFPVPAPEPEKIPLIIRAARYFTTILGVEPERPVPMPVVPELNFPALYTRFPIMKTVTKMTDINGEITVTYAQSYAAVPGVVISVKDPDNVFGTVFSTTLTGFEVRLFKMDHDHGGTVDNGGIHTPTINADGDHVHSVSGTITWDEYGNYGRLVLANYTDYEKLHTHTNITSAGGSAHRHVNNPTGYESDHTHSGGATGAGTAHSHTNPTTGTGSINHTHSIPATDGPDDTGNAMVDYICGDLCADEGCCIQQAIESGFAEDTHYHLNTGKNTGSSGAAHTHNQGITGTESAHTHSAGTTGAGSSHRHTVGDTQLESDHTHHIYPTGPGTYTDPLGHRHLISNNDLYDHYVTHISIDAFLETSAKESPYHDHSGDEIVAHAHVVAADGRVLLKNTNVTITYIAQEESA